MEAMPDATRDGAGTSYRLLGSLEVRRGPDGPVELGAPKQRAVLAVLLLRRGRVVPADRLVDLVWGDEAPASVLAGLQAYVSNLRRALRSPGGAVSPIVRRGAGYLLDVPADAVDAHAFVAAVPLVRRAAEDQRWDEALVAADAALALWRGDVLEGLEGLEGQAWVVAEAEPFEEQRTACREVRIAALLATNRVAEAVLAAQELRAAHPLRERAVWLQMVALHRAGRSSEALEIHRAHVSHLDEELGLEPGVELRELQVAVLRHDPALAAWPRPAGWTGATEVQVPTAPEPAPAAPALEPGSRALVGRLPELEALADARAEAAAGRPGWLLLTGPAGIGKSRLAERLARDVVEAGGREAWVRCPDEEGAPAWWAIRQLLRSVGEDPDVLLQPPPGTDVDEARFSLYDRAAAVLRGAVADGTPLVVVLDDVQWMDTSSARCLAYLAGALRDGPLIVAATLRDGEELGAAATLVAALTRAPGHRQLALGPLAVDDVRELASLVAGVPLSEHDAGTLAARTGGNPLFVGEYARLPADQRDAGQAPLAVSAVLGRRLAALDLDVLAALRAAAVLGDVVDLGLLTALTGLDGDVLADRLDDAVDEQVLVATPDTGGYAFAHGLLREEVLAGMPAGRRQRLHARAAELLDDPEDGDRTSQRARHLVAALGVVGARAVVDGCRAAALVHESRWSSETAAGWWAEALRAFDALPAVERDGMERDDLLVARVAALARAGRGQSVFDVLEASLLDAARTGRRRTIGLLAAAFLRSGNAWPLTVYGDRPGPTLERLAGLVDVVAADPAAHARVLAALAVGRSFDPDPLVPEALSDRSIERAEAADDPGALADALLGRLVAFSSVAPRVRPLKGIADRLLALDRPGARVDACITRSIGTMTDMTLGDVVAVEAAVPQLVAECDVLRLPVARVQLRWLEGTLAVWRGDLDLARRHYAIATRAHEQTEFTYPGTAAIAVGTLAREDGRLDEVDTSLVPEPACWEAAVAAARGDADAADLALGTWLAGLGAWSWLTLGYLVLAGHAAADAALAHRAPALLELLTPHTGGIGVMGQCGVTGPVDLAVGRLRALEGDAVGARAALHAALALADGTGGRPSAARCRAALAALPGA